MPSRGHLKHSHLRQVSAASSESFGSHSLGVYSESDRPAPDEKDTAERDTRHSSVGHHDYKRVIWVHDETFSKEEILFNQEAFSDAGVRAGDIIEILPTRPPGDAGHSIKRDTSKRAVHDNHAEPGSSIHSGTSSKFNTPLQTRCLFMAKPLSQDMRARHPKLEISVTSSIAGIFGFKNRTQVSLSVADRAECSASHVDISFRDQYLMRSDMWKLAIAELANKVIYKGQKLLFMGSIKATVKNIFVRGKKVLSGLFASHTIPVFRSESAKYVLFIQMSKEMWDFDSEGSGDILFSRVINGFLPELFKRWANSDARHLVTIVLFTRVEYTTSAVESLQSSNLESLKDAFNPGPFPTRDFYRVVVNDMASGHWTTILDELKNDFRTFLRDVSILKFEDGIPQIPDVTETVSKKYPVTIAGRPSSALRGNILEAVHLASAHLAFEHIDRDMVHTGTSIIVITPGSGLFEVSYESLASTTEALTYRGIAIDLVCLSPMPLHPVPLFKYHRPTQILSNAVTGHTASRGHSPEARQSFASFGSKSSRSSKLMSIHDSTSTGTLRGNVASERDEWDYGIPHWLDISYWNPVKYREARGLMKKDPNAPIPFTITGQSKTFVPRLRMYEIQMMGVMESEQSNISVPYLLEKHHPFKLLNPGHSFSPDRFVRPKSSYKQNTTYHVRFMDSLPMEPTLEDTTDTKSAMSSKPARQQLSVQWMDQYDDAVFKLFPKRRRPRRNPKLKRTSEPEVQLSGTHERISARSISRLREHEMDPSSHGYPARTIPKRTDTLQATRAGSSDAKNTIQVKPATKALETEQTSRISRAISFALRGLGGGPPRAEASIEVRVENAEALPMSNQRISMAVNSDTRNVHPLGSSNRTSVSTVASLQSTPVSSRKQSQGLNIAPTRPISIKTPSKKVSEGAELSERVGHLDSYSSTATEIPIRENVQDTWDLAKVSSPKFGMALDTSFPDGPYATSWNKALSPWVRSVNPCNTPRKALHDTSRFGRWQHAYPRPRHAAVIKWKSLKSPAILPLTTEQFPTADELSTEYLQTPYRVSANEDADVTDTPRLRRMLLREMISLRLSHGFQIVVGKNIAEITGHSALESLNIFDSHSLELSGMAIFLSKGNAIHRLVCVEDGEVEVTQFVRRNTTAVSPGEIARAVYSPAIRTILTPKYEVKDIVLEAASEVYNWNYADNYMAGHRDYFSSQTQQLHFWRVRYVLIPMRLPANAQRHLQPFNEDNEEEIHLLGIRQLTHIWQRNRYIPPEEKTFETGKKFVNPLNIMYQTRNASEIVTAEFDRVLLTDPGLDNAPTQLLPGSELLERSSVNISTLAQIIQGDRGVRMMDRRWHWRLHYNCFIGFELTTWLLQNFRDIDTREEATEFGNELMRHGVLQHVAKRHNFRDGNYFYQICSGYRIPRPESWGGWFPHKRPERAAPATPVDESAKGSPASSRARSISAAEEPAPQTPSTLSKSKNKVAIMLSKSMKYDVDTRKRSHRPEVVDLHYDRLHNPENCFHIELTWMNTTAKLVEDAVQSWASTAEKFGLRVVQVPVSEACSTDETQPFRRPHRVKLKIPPPSAPAPPVGSVPGFAQPSTSDRLYFQKSILLNFDFVLDFEPRSAFPSDVEVTYSWGKLEYKYAQYIHRSGTVLAQVTDEGDFLVLANRLVSTRGPLCRDTSRYDRADYRARANIIDSLARTSPHLSPSSRPVLEGSPFSPKAQLAADPTSSYRTPEHILASLVEFCNDAARLEQFYSEPQARVLSTKMGASVIDSAIPSLELPASVISNYAVYPPASTPRNSYTDVTSTTDTRWRPTVENRVSPGNGPFIPLTESVSQ